MRRGMDRWMGDVVRREQPELPGDGCVLGYRSLPSAAALGLNIPAGHQAGAGQVDFSFPSFFHHKISMCKSTHTHTHSHVNESH